MRRFIRDATALAYTRQRIQSNHGRARAQRDELRLLHAVTRDRQEVIAG
jgi:hypothetical protein